MAVVYSGDASYIISENPELGYYTPQQGTNTWYDAMVITKDCNEVDLAHGSSILCWMMKMLFPIPKK